MIKAIINGIISLIMSLVNLLLVPIDLVIAQVLPDLSNALTAIANMFNYAGECLGFIVDMTGLSSATINLIVVYYTFKLTAPLLFSTVKLAIKWYNSLKL